MKYHDLLKRDSRITIMALSWRDIKSPTAGGAEVHTHEMLRRIDRSSYRVIHIAARYGREKESEMIDGVQYIRKGNPVSVIWYAFFYYQRNRKNIDFVIDQCNTHRFFPTKTGTKKHTQVPFSVHTALYPAKPVPFPLPMPFHDFSCRNTRHFLRLLRPSLQANQIPH